MPPRRWRQRRFAPVFRCRQAGFPAAAQTLPAQGDADRPEPGREAVLRFRLRATPLRHPGRAQHLLERFGLVDKSKELVESLSGGMRRRLQVARALISEPKVLVLDEPTTGLDPDARRTLWEILEHHRSRGLAILLTTHYMEEAERLCDRVAILHGGVVLDVNTPRNLIDSHVKKEWIEEEIRPGVKWKRPANLEDVYLKVTGSRLAEGASHE